jgi:hypothetical protein
MNHESDDVPGAAARRVRTWTRLSALALAGAAFYLGGTFGLTGAVIGGLLAEANLGLLVLTLDRAPRWRGQSIKGTLFRFYLAFAAPACSCFLAVHFSWGHPLAFLAGVMSPMAGLALALLSFAVWPLKQGGTGP